MTASDGIKHGGSSGYTIHKCRCAECSAWKSEAGRAYRVRMGDELKAKKRAYGIANRDALRAKVQARRLEWTPEQRQSANDYQRQWAKVAYANGRPRTDATKARRKQRDAERRDILRANEAAYRATNAQKRRDWEAARRARMRGADVRSISDQDWRRLLNRYGNRCAYCGTGGVLTQDHIIPLVRGGRHAIGNLIPACGSCNSSKNARFIVEWKAAKRAA